MNEDDNTPEEIQVAVEMRQDFMREEKMLAVSKQRTIYREMLDDGFALKQQLDRIEHKLDKLLEAKKPKVRKKVTDNPEFDVFWDKYPVRKGKQAALRAWNGLAPSKVLVTLINVDIKDRLENDRAWQDKQFILHASTYLNGERWNDSIEAIPVKAETLPKDNALLDTWAANRGERLAYPGESYADHRKYLQAKLGE